MAVTFLISKELRIIVRSVFALIYRQLIIAVANGEKNVLWSFVTLLRELFFEPYIIVARVLEVVLDYNAVLDYRGRHILLLRGEAHILRREGTVRSYWKNTQTAVELHYGGLNLVYVKISL